MCYFIGAENILLNYFASKNDRNEVTSRALNTLKEILERELGNVYIDVTAQAIRTVAIHRRREFRMEPTVVKLVAPEKFHKEITCHKVAETYNWRIPESIRDKYMKLIAEYHEL